MRQSFNKKIVIVFFYTCFLVITADLSIAQPDHDLHFTTLANRWDEAIPLGNGVMGALLWLKGDNLRFSLDRADLWDNRPMNGLQRKEFSYAWVVGQVAKNDYGIVQKYLDEPYDRESAPCKIPGGALEFKSSNWGNVLSVHLYVQNALCEIKWTNGILLKTFVHAQRPVGWFRFENVPADFTPILVPPDYHNSNAVSDVPLSTSNLAALGYLPGTVKCTDNSIIYRQPGWNGFEYEISVKWKKINASTLEGAWSISTHYPNKKSKARANVITQHALQLYFQAAFLQHKNWWQHFWQQSAIHLPDPLLEKQWYLEMYKFGSASRRGALPISLQAVWTADDGNIPPWKGDYHHDLNTQMSYWPGYSANHLTECMAYLDHLDANKPNYRNFTRLYFGKKGLNVPGVTTLDGSPMGGWIQYALSPTTAAWLAQHYYLQWRYSMDKAFLRRRAYPWTKDVAQFIENITFKNKQGFRQLPISSSPEINGNNISAWFLQNTNYDLALMKNAMKMAHCMALELGLTDDAAHWQQVYDEFDDFALSANAELMFAPTLPYKGSHRHFSHLMAIHPLGLINWEQGEKSQRIIRRSLHLLDSIGTSQWCGYSFAWEANLKARAKDGEGAAKALGIFVSAFCSTNSFHLNGDQTKSGYSDFTYRPFTLEGNFAFAAGVQEMLLQSYAGFIELFPAVPASWQDVSFEKLRAEGAFLVSANRTNGHTSKVNLTAEKGGIAILKLSFDEWKVTKQKGVTVAKSNEGWIRLNCLLGGVIQLRVNPKHKM